MPPGLLRRRECTPRVDNGCDKSVTCCGASKCGFAAAPTRAWPIEGGGRQEGLPKTRLVERGVLGRWLEEKTGSQQITRRPLAPPPRGALGPHDASRR